jgi:hypothetical protein
MTRHEASQLLKLMDALASLHSSVLPPLQQLNSIWPVLCSQLSSLHQGISQCAGQDHQHQGSQAQAGPGLACGWLQGGTTGQDTIARQPGLTAVQFREAISLAQQGESLLRLVTTQVEAAQHIAEVAKRCVAWLVLTCVIKELSCFGA